MEAVDTPRPPDPRSVYELYRQLEPEFERAALTFRTRVSAAVFASGVHPEAIKARHKQPLELFKKQRKRKYENPWLECPDLVGVRVVVPLASDKPRVIDALRTATDVEVFEVDDKQETAEPDQLAYLGLHVHLHGSGISVLEGTPVRCEVQVRTVAEHSWAETEHTYVYKKASSLPRDVQRVFRRLLVLVELFDEELSRGVDLVKDTPGFAEVKLVRFLEEQFESIAGIVGDEDVTIESVRAVSASVSDPAKLLELVRQYVDAHRDQVDNLLLNHGSLSTSFDVEHDWLTTQPELLLFLAMLNQNPHALSTTLYGTDLYSYVEPIALWTGANGFIQN